MELWLLTTHPHECGTTAQVQAGCQGVMTIAAGASWLTQRMMTWEADSSKTTASLQVVDSCLRMVMMTMLVLAKTTLQQEVATMPTKGSNWKCTLPAWAALHRPTCPNAALIVSVGTQVCRRPCKVNVSHGCWPVPGKLLPTRTRWPGLGNCT